jgi:hypothetical protein
MGGFSTSVGFVPRDKRFVRPSTAKDKTSKNKGKKNISLSRTQNI